MKGARVRYPVAGVSLGGQAANVGPRIMTGSRSWSCSRYGAMALRKRFGVHRSRLVKDLKILALPLAERLKWYARRDAVDAAEAFVSHILLRPVELPSGRHAKSAYG